MSAVLDRNVGKPSPLLLLALLLAVFVVPISIAGTAVALPSIAADIGTDPVPLQWVLNGFNVAFAAFTLVWGSLSDRIGYKRTFVGGTALMIVASVLSSLAPNLLVLDAGRFIAGMAAAAIFTSATAIMSNTYAPAARMRSFGILGTVLGLGLALGPAISGTLTSVIGWRGVFLAFAASVALSLILSASIPALAREHSGHRKLVDFSLLRNPHFLAISLVPVVQAVGFISMLTYLPVALSAVWGMDAGLAGTAMLVMTIPILITPIIAVRLVARSPRITTMKVVFVALVSLLLGDIGMLFVGPGIPVTFFFLPMVLLGLGLGLPLGLIDGEALGSVPAHSAGTAAGVFNFLRIGSEALAIGAYAAALAWLIQLSANDPELADHIASGQPGHPELYASAFFWVQLATIALVVLGALAIALLSRTAHTSRGVVREGIEGNASRT
jgi:predicted MFS family arabinose efflux permease